MKIRAREYVPAQDKADYTFLADSVADIPADMNERYPDAAVGSTIIVIEIGAMIVKNTKGKWQKFGTSEVI